MTLIASELVINYSNIFGSRPRKRQHQLSLGVPCRRIIGLDTIDNRFELLVGSFIAAAATPCATHMRHQFVFACQIEKIIGWRYSTLAKREYALVIMFSVIRTSSRRNCLQYPYKIYKHRDLMAYPSGRS